MQILAFFTLALLLLVQLPGLLLILNLQLVNFALKIALFDDLFPFIDSYEG